MFVGPRICRLLSQSSEEKRPLHIPHVRCQYGRSVVQESLDQGYKLGVYQTDDCSPHSVSGVGFLPVLVVDLCGSFLVVGIPGSPGVSSHKGISPHRPGGTEPDAHCICM